MAIIDQTLFLRHEEYANRIAGYTEIGTVAPMPEIHGAAVASILAGQDIGVAPEVTVDYLAAQVMKDWNSDTRTFYYVAHAIGRILDQNKGRPPGQRVRVISISNGAAPDEEGYMQLQEAYGRAIQEGVLVVTTDMKERYGHAIHGLGRDPYADPNDVNSYRPGAFWAPIYYLDPDRWHLWAKQAVYAPMDSRTTAAESGQSDCRFCRQGGLSWAVPYAAGVYALVVQVYPQVTPEEFLQAAYNTGSYATYTHEGKQYRLGPSALLAQFQARAGN